MWTVPNFVSDVSEKGAPLLGKPLKINRIDGAGKEESNPHGIASDGF
jgi:hypothetical protein